MVQPLAARLLLVLLRAGQDEGRVGWKAPVETKKKMEGKGGRLGTNWLSKVALERKARSKQSSVGSCVALLGPGAQGG